MSNSDPQGKLSRHIIDSYILKQLGPREQEELLRRRAFERERQEIEREIVADLEEQLLQLVEAKIAGQPYDQRRVAEIISTLRQYKGQPAPEEITANQARSKLDRYISEHSGL